MGSPLGSTFANYYMGHFKNIILEDHNIKQYTYVKYVDDIYIEIENEITLLSWKKFWKYKSFKIHRWNELNNKLPFLDVLPRI